MEKNASQSQCNCQYYNFSHWKCMADPPRQILTTSTLTTSHCDGSVDRNLLKTFDPRCVTRRVQVGQLELPKWDVVLFPVDLIKPGMTVIGGLKHRWSCMPSITSCFLFVASVVDTSTTAFVRGYLILLYSSEGLRILSRGCPNTLTLIWLVLKDHTLTETRHQVYAP